MRGGHRGPGRGAAAPAGALLVMSVLFVQAVLLVVLVLPVAPVVLAGSVFSVFSEDVVEYAADRQAYRRDRRMGTHVRFPS
ncbi:hypothetical protein GCM10009535_37030 [Streptomyces thermocarboxydovorans]|uniref:Uncharacterized protein n=1 Tax=Streptomyces thermocarboxydovorans TaxID=59298 RepID=A0ABN1HJY3_9ACTN